MAFIIVRFLRIHIRDWLCLFQILKRSYYGYPLDDFLAVLPKKASLALLNFHAGWNFALNLYFSESQNS